MFLLDGNLHWSASDLTAAAQCEYAVLRTLDYKLGRADRIDVAADPLVEHIARLGDRHEERLLSELEGAGDVARLARVAPPYTRAKLEAAGAATRQALQHGPRVLHQAAFFDGEFFGYADFLEPAEDGWLVCDAKLARSAKPQALLQLGAYADQLRRLGEPLSATVSLLLGDGGRADFRVADLLPVFGERREHLRALLSEHQERGSAVEWGEAGLVACGRCPECEAAAERADDLILVAGLRMEQRRKLRAGGIRTIGDLATATAPPEDLTAVSFEKLRAQARLQWRQRRQGAPVDYELTDSAATTLALLPAPSPGDLFFDFEGDPMYDEGDPSRVGLEYLWGVLDSAEKYDASWAHSWAEERTAFREFMDGVAERRAAHPDLHIYHYAPYETTALKRLAARYQTREKELDDLLRSEVFVDLYAVVRGSVRVSQPSYSIKKLEPLYMGDRLRESDVADGAGSIVAYREFREVRDEDPAAAGERLDALADYNEYDCLSTLRLRDWLLDRAAEAGVRDRIAPRVRDEQGEELSEDDPLFLKLMARSGPERRSDRSPEQQAYAMLANALDYHRREDKQFWWEHFERLGHPAEAWSRTRDIFVIESAEVVSDWAVPGGRATNHRRVVRLVGDWTPGSKPGRGFHVVYDAPGPPGAFGPEGAPYIGAEKATVELDPDDPRVVSLTEAYKPADTFAALPVALAPGRPPYTEPLRVAIREVADLAAASGAGPESLPERAVLDLLARRRPRLTGSPSGGSLPEGGSAADRVVRALVGMRDSYVAIQGPPGTGKTFTGSHVIRELVERHRWRVGVVAQSHAVVENALAGIVKAGLDPELVGKAKTESKHPTWTPLTNVVKFLGDHAATGCVIGGTAWAFANAKSIERDSLDLLVVDEAGQFSLAMTIAASVAARRLLLLGDPRQLPQVSQGSHAEPVDESALGWLMADHDTLPPDLGYFLAESYRMHPALCAKVSALSYEGRLFSAPAASARHLDGVEPGLSVVELDHHGNQTESPEEAVAVVAQVRALLGTTWREPDAAPRPLGEDDFLVVAPYNAQVSLIRAALDAAGLHRVRVGTVDKFQGQEAPVAIVSMTASSHGDVPRGMGFLLNRNRVNVAVSRAQWLAVVVRSRALTSYMPSSAAGVLELGAFIGLCQPH